MAAASVHLGLNRVSAAHYGGEQPLRGCIADAQSMRAIALANGFTPALLLDDAATVANLAQAMTAAAAQLDAGDTFFLSYAGHGSQVFDGDGQEPDGLNETLCLFDRMLIDDELHGLIAAFKRGVRILVVTDSCHSASATREIYTEDDSKASDGPAYPSAADIVARGLEDDLSRAVYRASADVYDAALASSAGYRDIALACTKLHLAACQDNQLAADVADHGYFTKQLLFHLGNGASASTYDNLFQALDHAMPRRQKPNLEIEGEPLAAFTSGRPFST